MLGLVEIIPCVFVMKKKLYMFVITIGQPEVYTHRGGRCAAQAAGLAVYPSPAARRGRGNVGGSRSSVRLRGGKPSPRSVRSGPVRTFEYIAVPLFALCSTAGDEKMFSKLDFSNN